MKKDIKKKIMEKMTPRKGEVTGIHLDKPGFGDTKTRDERKSKFSVRKDKNS